MFLLIASFWTTKQFGFFDRTYYLAQVALAAASLQLLRRPDALKSKLREWRVASGPLYMMSVSSYFCHSLSSGGVNDVFLAGAGLWSVALAGIALRPDNQILDRAVLALLPDRAVLWPAQYSTRVKYHRILMVLSLTLMTCLLALEEAWTSVALPAFLIVWNFVAERVQWLSENNLRMHTYLISFIFFSI